MHNDKIQYIEVSLNKIYHIEGKNDDFGIIYYIDDLVLLTNDSHKVHAKALIRLVAKKYNGELKIVNFTTWTLLKMRSVNDDKPMVKVSHPFFLHSISILP